MPLARPEVYGPPAHDIPDRLNRVEKASAGKLPSRMTLNLAQGTMDDRYLERAARMLGKLFDLTPPALLQPALIYSSGQVATYTDPVTGGPISLATARRYARLTEPKYITKMLRSNVRQIPSEGPHAPTAPADPRRVAAVVRALAPLDGENVNLAAAMGAAIQIARDTSIDLKLFTANLDFIAKHAPSLDGLSAIAGAQSTAAKGIHVRDMTDVGVAILGGKVRPVLRQGLAEQHLEEAASHEALLAGRRHGTPDATLGHLPDVIFPGLDQPSVGGPQATGEFGQRILAGLAGPEDFTKLLQDAHDDYVNYGKEIAREIHIPFTDSWASNHIIEPGLNIINRPLDGAWRLIGTAGLSLGNGLREVFGKDSVDQAKLWSETWKDEWDIFAHGHSAVDQLAAQGVNPWFSTVGELALGAVAVSKLVEAGGIAKVAGYAIDPFQASLSELSLWKARHLISGLAEQGKAAEALGRVSAFVDGPVRTLGGLRNVTVAQYLLREADRTKNAEKMFGRAVDQFRRWTGNDGISPIIAARLFDYAKTTKKLGLSEAERLDGVRGMMFEGFGINAADVGVDMGSLVHQIEAFGRMKTEEDRAALVAELASKPTTLTKGAEMLPSSPLSRDTEQAMGALSNAEADLLAGRQMVEIPHVRTFTRPIAGLRASPLADTVIGKTIRSLGYAPPRIGSRLNLSIEQGESSVKDFERALLRSKSYTAEQIATRKLDFAHAIDVTNPNRESDFRLMVGQANYQTLRRINGEFGLDRVIYDAEDQLKLIKGDLTRAQKAGNAADIESAKLQVSNAEENVKALKKNSVSDLVISKLDQKFGKYGRSETYGVLVNRPLEMEGLRVRRQITGLEERLNGPLDDAARITTQRELDSLNRQLRTLENTSAGPIPLTERPILASELLNDMEMIDPALYRNGVKQMMGIVRDFTNAGRKALRVGIPDFHPKLLARHGWTVNNVISQTLDTVINDLFLTIWKPLVVLRPAYILRVVGLEEQGRFLSVAGMSRRLESGRYGASLEAALGISHDREISTGVRTLAEQAGTRSNEVEDALLYLSQRDADRATLLNGVGFSKQDSDLGNALADVIRRGGTLDAKTRRAARDLVQGYGTQLRAAGIDAMKLRVTTDAEKAAAAARRTQDKVDQGILTFKAPGLRPNEPLANNTSIRLALSSEKAQSKALENLLPNKIGVITRDDPQFHTYWNHTLSHIFGNDALGRRYLDDIVTGKSAEASIERNVKWLQTDPEGQVYLNRLLGGQGFEKGIQEAFTDLQVRQGVTYARELARQPAVAKMAHDGVLTENDLKMLSLDDTPLYVHGPLMAEQLTGRFGAFKRGFRDLSKAILQTPTNALSRQPFYKMWSDRMERGLIETATASGRTITPEMLKGFQETARQFALEQVRRIMFDFSRTGRLEELSRWFLVFVQPLLEFPVAWTRVLRQNPSAIGQIIRLGRAAVNSGFLQTDPDTGQLGVPLSWFAFASPLLAAAYGGEQGKGPGKGWSLSAPLTSFNLFANNSLSVPVPGLGDVPLPLPSMTTPFQMLMQNWVNNSNLDANLKARLGSYLFQYGDYNASNLSFLLPAYMRHVLAGAMPEWFQNEINMQSTNFLQLQQALGFTPDAKLARSQAETFSYWRALFGLIFPAAPRIKFPSDHFGDELKQLRDTYGYIDGTDRFRQIHPDLSLMTIGQTIWDGEQPGASALPIPASRLVQQLLSSKGAKEFASKYPWLVWSIIPSELQTQKNFDIGVFFQQIAAGQRKVLSPEAFLASANVQAGWQDWNAEDARWTTQQEVLAEAGIGQGDPPYEAAKIDHDQRVMEIRAAQPEWSAAFDAYSNSTQVPPNVMGSLRTLATDPTYLKTDTGQGLAAYFQLRDSIEQRLHDANIRDLFTKGAADLGLTGEYTDGVAQIITEHPDFGKLYNIAFKNVDLKVVATGSDQMLAKLTPDQNAQLVDWWKTFEADKAAPNAAATKPDVYAAYDALRAYEDTAYRFPDAQNPMLLKWATDDPQEKQDYVVRSVLPRQYQFLSRFDKQEILGETGSNQGTQDLWTQYEQIRAGITQAEATNPNFNQTKGYAILDLWVRQQAGANPQFAREVAHANTWGYTFEQALKLKGPDGRPVLFDSHESGTYWSSFLDAVRQVQAVATQYQLTGPGDPDPNHVIVWNAMAQSLLGYEQKLASESHSFAAQWKFLEDSSSDPALSIFVPDIYFPLGVVDPNALKGVH